MKLLVVVALAACTARGRADVSGEQQPSGRTGGPDVTNGNDPPGRDHDRKLAAIGKDALCVTKGAVALGKRVGEPTVRAIVRGTGGDEAMLTFVFHGDSDTKRALKSGQERRQLGLKLRAENGCNLVYVMWRLDPKPQLEVSTKRNPGKRTHKECGADGYTKIKPSKSGDLPALEVGGSHTLRAAIDGDELIAWIDDREVWRGSLPESVRDLRGPAGLRADNVAFDLVAFHATPGDGTAAKCVEEDSD